MSLLTVVQAVCEKAGIPLPTIVIGTTDPQVQQMRGLYEALGNEVAGGEYRWQWQTRSAQWVSTAAEDQGSLFTLAGASFLGMINKTFWNFTQQRRMIGPLSDEAWQVLKATTPAGPLYHYMLSGNRVLINPVPVAGETYSFRWLSSDWISSADGATLRTTFAADGDISLVPEHVMKVGLQAWWARQKGLPYAELLASFDRMLETAKAKDGTKPTLSLDSEGPQVRPGIFVPAGNWNIP